MEELASVHHAPLVTKEVAGRSVPAYDLPAHDSRELEAEPCRPRLHRRPRKVRRALRSLGDPARRSPIAAEGLSLLPRRRALGLGARVARGSGTSSPACTSPAWPSSATACSLASTSASALKRRYLLKREGAARGAAPLCHAIGLLTCSSRIHGNVPRVPAGAGSVYVAGDRLARHAVHRLRRVRVA